MSGNKVFYLLHPGVEGLHKTVFSVSHPTAPAGFPTITAPADAQSCRDSDPSDHLRSIKNLSPTSQEKFVQKK